MRYLLTTALLIAALWGLVKPSLSKPTMAPLPESLALINMA
jgi:hypothetical protein